MFYREDKALCRLDTRTSLKIRPYNGGHEKSNTPPTDFHVAHAGLCFFDATTNLKETINKVQNLTTKELPWDSMHRKK
jgi:hypothetical protein